MSILLDVNLLVALAWPNHVHHGAARRWFDDRGASGWATTPITETGFVRISSNRGAMPTSTSPPIAIELLQRMTGYGEHEFWPDDVPLVVGKEFVATDALRGHRQVTDAHLVALARRRQGRLATLDRGIAELDGGQTVDLIAP